MTIREIYEKNIKLQYIGNQIIRAAHRQNYDRVYRNLGALIAMLSPWISECEKRKEEIGIDIAQSGIANFLGAVMEAQKASDAVLIADLLELQMLPFFESVQESMRNHCDILFHQEIWEENRKGLCAKDQELAELVLKEQKEWLSEDDPSFWLEPTNSGLFTMASRDDKGVYYLHSNANPQTEALDFADYYYDAGCEDYIVLGLGLGYHIEALAKMDEGLRIFVYEDNISVIVQAMMANDMDWLWTNDRIVLSYDPDFRKMSKMLSLTEAAAGKARFLIHYPSLRHVENEAVKEKLELLFIRDSGIRNMGALLESNFRENIRNYTDTVDGLKSRFAGKRAVIVAAGPSLDKNVTLLLNKPEDVIIIATGTVFRKLMDLGIPVDFVIVSDANRRIYGQLSGHLTSGVPLIYLSTAYQGFARNYQGEKYIVLQKDFESSVQMAKELGVSTYATGGSVSTTALEICIRLGCLAIAFIGLDLAYTDNFAHAKGTSRRVANDIEDMPKVKGYVMDADADGGWKETEVSGSRLFDLYRRWMEKRLEEKDVCMPVYDATEGGSIKKGMKICTLSAYLDNQVTW